MRCAYPWLSFTPCRIAAGHRDRTKPTATTSSSHAPAVAEVRKKREDLRSGGVETLLLGGALTAGAIALGIEGFRGALSQSSSANTWGTIGIIFDANIVLPLAIVADWIGLAHVLAPAPYDVRVD
jgi:hypothetical protein